jgi:hypothetical protein
MMPLVAIRQKKKDYFYITVKFIFKVFENGIVILLD